MILNSADNHNLAGTLGLQVYNGIDCCITYEVFERISAIQPAYDFARACAAPAMEMMLRGFRVNTSAIGSLQSTLQSEVIRLQAQLDTLASAVWGRGLNPRSNAQLCEFFYTCLDLPKQFKSVKGSRHLAADREALEKLKVYFWARPFISHILAIRDSAKVMDMFKKGLDWDGRYRTSYNVCGTETFRWSSSKNAFGRGGNLQNIPDRIRRLFIPDPGMKLGQGDLEQAESRAVAYGSGDEAYISACESGDVHTFACRLCWPELPWTGNLKLDRELADGDKFYREYTRRYMMKRAGHGSNYRGSPWTLAKHTNTPVKVMEDFQAKYFGAFSGIRTWHERVTKELKVTGKITNAFGFTRYFLGRRDSDDTIREAIAFGPQSEIGILANLGLWRTWRRAPVQILAQVHDAVVFQFDPAREEEAVAAVRDAMTVPVPYGSRTMTVPVEIATGWNWGKVSKDNEFGLRPWNGTDTRKAPEMLDRRLP